MKFFYFLFFYFKIFFKLVFNDYEVYKFLNWIMMQGFEKLNILNKLYTFLILTFTTRKKYLKEKFWSQKEKQERLKTWAWKHEGKLSTYKGFHIPIVLPQTDQAKFFQKKKRWRWAKTTW